MKIKFLAILISILTSTFAHAGSNPDTWKYAVRSGDVIVKGSEVIKLLTGKQLRVGSRFSNNLTVGKRKQIYDKFGKIKPNLRWAVSRIGVFCILDKNSKYANCYKIVRQGGNLYMAGTKRRHRLWLKPGKIS